MFEVLLLETHNQCTRRCWFCKFGQARQDNQVNKLPWEVLTKIATELETLNYAGRISPFGINEPLLDDRIFDIIALFRDACPNAHISINTNGDRLHHGRLNRLFDVGLSALGISIYDQGGWERFYRLRNHPRVALLDMRQPIGKIENRGGTILRKPEAFDPQQFQATPCLRPSTMLVMKATGKAVLCCADQYGDVELGDVRDRTLVEIWESPEFVALRQRLQQGHRQGLKLCEGCSHRGSTSPVDYPKIIQRG